MARNVILSVLLTTAFVVMRPINGYADLLPHETGVFADAGAINGQVLFDSKSHPSQIMFSGSDLFNGNIPPEINPQFFSGSAVISSDSPIAATFIEGTQKTSTQIIPNGNRHEISTGAGMQSTFQIQNASGPTVDINVEFTSSPILVTPTNGPSGSSSATGTSVTIRNLMNNVPGTPIESFSGFAELNPTGSVVVSGDFAAIGVVNDAGSSIDEHRKQLTYSGVLDATVDSNGVVQVSSSTFCISNLTENGFSSATASYSCFDNNTFAIRITSSDPNARFRPVNITAVPEPTAACFFAVVFGIGILRKCLQSVNRWLRLFPQAT